MFENYEKDGDEFVRRALDYDEKMKNYVEALRSYQQGLICYEKALQNNLTQLTKEELANRKRVVKKHFDSVSLRVENIKAQENKKSKWYSWIASAFSWTFSKPSEPSEPMLQPVPPSKQQYQSSGQLPPPSGQCHTSSSTPPSSSFPSPGLCPSSSSSSSSFNSRPFFQNSHPNHSPPTNFPYPPAKQQQQQQQQKKNVQIVSIPSTFEQLLSYVKNSVVFNLEKREAVAASLQRCDKESIEATLREIVTSSPNQSWDNVIGLSMLKGLLREIVVYPILRPDIFKGIRAPPKGLLLFGPPGTGKTMVAKALATEANCRLFAMSASSLVSKWVGEGEKQVRALFAVACSVQPSIIFVDEIDSLLSARSTSEQESSRRMKTEFLVQMDGVSSGSDDHVVFIGATNRPFDLDEAVLRRMPRRVYLPLPSPADRLQLLLHLLNASAAATPYRLSEAELKSLAARTENYSNADLTQLCKDAAFGPIRRVSEQGGGRVSVVDLPPHMIPPIEYGDFLVSLNKVKPCVNAAQLKEFANWNNTFGTK